MFVWVAFFETFWVDYLPNQRSSPAVRLQPDTLEYLLLLSDERGMHTQHHLFILRPINSHV